MKNLKLGLILMAILTLLSLVSCSDLYVVPEQEYRIAAGAHESKLIGGWPTDKMRTLKQSELTFTARFDDSARYDLGNKNQDDINKLMGFSEANKTHHDYSIRFGWRYNQERDMVEIFGYQYQAGKRKFVSITNVPIGETVTYSIAMFENEFLMSVGSEARITMERGVEDKLGVYYLLYPYFGGNETAPHDISIYIKEMFSNAE